MLTEESFTAATEKYHDPLDAAYVPPDIVSYFRRKINDDTTVTTDDLCPLTVEPLDINFVEDSAWAFPTSRSGQIALSLRSFFGLNFMRNQRLRRRTQEAYRFAKVSEGAVPVYTLEYVVFLSVIPKILFGIALYVLILTLSSFSLSVISLFGATICALCMSVCAVAVSFCHVFLDPRYTASAYRTWVKETYDNPELRKNLPLEFSKVAEEYLTYRNKESRYSETHSTVRKELRGRQRRLLERQIDAIAKNCQDSTSTLDVLPKVSPFCNFLNERKRLAAYGKRNS